MPKTSLLTHGGLAAALAAFALSTQAAAATFSGTASVDLTFATAGGAAEGLSITFDSAGGKLIQATGDASADAFGEGSDIESGFTYPDYSVVALATGEAGAAAPGSASAEADQLAVILFDNASDDAVRVSYDFQWLVEATAASDGTLPIEDTFAFADIALELDGMTIFEALAVTDPGGGSEAMDGFELLEIVLAPNSQRELAILALVGGDATAAVPVPGAALAFATGLVALGAVRTRRRATLA